MFVSDTQFPAFHINVCQKPTSISIISRGRLTPGRWMCQKALKRRIIASRRYLLSMDATATGMHPASAFSRKKIRTQWPLRCRRYSLLPSDSQSISSDQFGKHQPQERPIVLPAALAVADDDQIALAVSSQ